MMKSILGALIGPVATIFTKRVERKIAKDELRHKAAVAKQSDATQITLTDAEWEIVKASTESSSLKDEYVTILGTWPLAGIMLGALVAAVTGDREILDGTVEGIRILNEVGVPMPEIMTGVVFAAIGLKLWRS